MSLDAKRSEAARVAAGVDLRDIRLWGVEAELSNVPDESESGLSYLLNADLQVQRSPDDTILLVLGRYTLDVSAASPPAQDGEDEEGSEDSAQEAAEVASISFRLNALFEVEHEPEGEPFTESELTAFGETTGQFALYPYARQLVADLTGRMGLPPLHMGVMRLDLESRDG